MSTTSKEDYHDDHDFSVVEKQHIDDSSMSSDTSDESLYDPEDDGTSDSEDEEFNNKFNSVDDMLKRRILDAQNQDIYHENNFVTKEGNSNFVIRSLGTFFVCLESTKIYLR